MIIVETNSCPSGQKSMPLLAETDEFGGYKVVLESAFSIFLSKADKSLGALPQNVPTPNRMAWRSYFEYGGYWFCSTRREFALDPY